MKIIRFDSVGGASGDMILGALIGLGADIDILNRELASLLPSEKFKITVSPKESHGINGIAATVEIEEHYSHHHPGQHGHHHKHDGRTFADIRQLIMASQLNESVKSMTIKVFAALAEAEGNIHNMTADQVHFHEVGAVDSIVDITGCCLAMHILGIQWISVSPLPSGQGTFKCRHGIYPIPAPATIELMKNLKSILTDEPYELVTPTGAALLSVWPHLEIPSSGMIVKTSNSFGQRKLDSRPNLLRAILYESPEENRLTEQSDETDSAVILETNIDDCPAEFIGPLFERLLNAGALDVWITPIMMKKQRPGTMLSVICKSSYRTTLYDIIFRETTTFGIREYSVSRQCLERRFEQVETSFGKVKIKVGSRNKQDITSSPEIDDCIRLSAQARVSVKEVYLAAVKAQKQ
ncbi:MAG: nickel pincer cofactor biosynthesis protein LarC [Victivallaceae bacterium]